MKNKKIILCVAVVIIIAVIGALLYLNQSSSVFSVENDKNGNITVTAQKSGAYASGIGYITLEDEQKLEVRTNLTDNSSIKIEVLPKNIDATTKVLMEETFTSIDAREFELPSGDYTIRVTAKKVLREPWILKPNNKENVNSLFL